MSGKQGGKVMSFLGRKIRKKGGETALYEESVISISKGIFKKKFVKTSARKRTSLCLSDKLRASMTVEAAFVIPFFLFALLNIISILEIYRIQSDMSAAMHRTVKEMAVYAYEYRELVGEDTGKAQSLGLTYVYAANCVRSILEKENADNFLVKGGMSQVNWTRSSVLENDDCIDLIAAYTIKSPVAAVGFSDFKMYNRMFARAWTGYDNAAAALNNNFEDDIVYITPEGTVYHRSRVCTYLKLSIVPVDIDVLEDKRNEGRAKYYPCEECGKVKRSMVYITDYGTRYHTSLQCSKLKRTIFAVPLSQVDGRSGCSKCG